MTLYCSLDEVKAAMRVTDTNDDGLIGAVIEAVSQRIEGACGGREFGLTASTARYFVATSRGVVLTDDIGSATFTVATDTAGDGTYATTLTAAEVQAEPLNEIGKGRPIRRIRTISTGYFPVSYAGRATVKITTTWGWPTIPYAIREATRLMVMRQFNRFNSPLGVQSLGIDLGAISIRSIDPDIAALIQPFVLWGIA